MWVAVVSSLICFAVATILFTPPLRSFPFYQAVSFYFLFEGAWTLLNAVVLAIWNYSLFMVWVHYFGSILCAGYLFYCLFIYYCKQKQAQKTENKVQEVQKSQNIQIVKPEVLHKPEPEKDAENPETKKAGE